MSGHGKISFAYLGYSMTVAEGETCAISRRPEVGVTQNSAKKGQAGVRTNCVVLGKWWLKVRQATHHD